MYMIETHCPSSYMIETHRLVGLPANDVASSWWLDLTPKWAKWRHHNRGETFETTPHSYHQTYFTHLISPFHLGDAQNQCSATLLPIRPHPLAPHGPLPLTFPLLRPLLSHISFTSRRCTLSGCQRASSTFSVSLSGRELNLTQAPSKTHAQSVAIGFTQVGSPCYAWCVTNGATAAVLGFTPQQTTGRWPRGAAPHAPSQSHLAAPTRELESSNLERTRSTLSSGDSLSFSIASSSPPAQTSTAVPGPALVQLKRHPPLPRRTSGLPASPPGAGRLRPRD